MIGLTNYFYIRLKLKIVVKAVNSKKIVETSLNIYKKKYLG